MTNRDWKNIPAVFGDNNVQQVFGSLNTGSIIPSSDPETLATNFAQGFTAWKTTTDSSGNTINIPNTKEWEGIYKCFSEWIYQLFQYGGIPLYSSSMTYHLSPTPSIVRDPTSSKIYITLVDNNINYLLTNNTKWKFLCDLEYLEYLQSTKFNTANNIPLLDANGLIPVANLPSTTIVPATESTSGIIKIATQDQVTTGTDNATAVSPLKLSQRIAGMGSIVESYFDTYAGYIKYSNGLMEQWGQIEYPYQIISGGTAAFSLHEISYKLFPIAFTNCYNISFSGGYINDASDAYSKLFWSFNTRYIAPTGFELYGNLSPYHSSVGHSGTIYLQVTWRAMGYWVLN